ncbi:MAG: DUF4256 domain-containing protein [Solobacterium sp.]|nr:DUF4256 domain-containing protein [Solobacterium sp.]
MIEVLKKRFYEHMERHPDMRWEDVEVRFNENNLTVLKKMEETGGEPDTIGFDETGMILYCDCSKETPKGRRSLCFDEEALRNRKKNPPLGSVEKQAEEIGVTLLTEAMYQRLQELEPFDLKTSSWIATPDEIRALGGALFCERRYGKVFTFHNGADSYYSVRGWRGYLSI